MTVNEPINFMPLDLDTFAGSERFMAGTRLGAAFSQGIRAYLRAAYGDAADALAPTLAALVAAVCLYWLAVYSMSGNYFMQTLFLTPMLLIFATLGDEEKGLVYTGERVFFTIVGVAVGVVAAIVLDRWDKVAADRVA